MQWNAQLLGVCSHALCPMHWCEPSQDREHLHASRPFSGDILKGVLGSLKKVYIPAASRMEHVPLLTGTWARCVWKGGRGQEVTAHRRISDPWPFSSSYSVWSLLSRNYVRLCSTEIFWLCELDHAACDKSPSLSLGILKTDETADSWLFYLVC